MRIDAVRARLLELADPEYRAFNEKLVPGQQNTLGVRLPALRTLAREIARDGLQEYAAGDSYEEIMLEGLAISYAKLPLGETLKRLEAFVPKIDNWAVCDSVTMGLRFMEQSRETVWPWLDQFLLSEKPFAVRFALVSMLAHFVVEDYVDRVIERVDAVRSDHYYARMAAAWLVAECYVKFPEAGRSYLTRDRLDDFTHDKAIQKIRESFRVTDEDKRALLKLKRRGAKAT